MRKNKLIEKSFVEFQMAIRKWSFISCKLEIHIFIFSLINLARNEITFQVLSIIY